MTPQTGDACQPPVAGEQSHVQRLGEGDVGGVVDSEVVGQLPAAGQQGPVRSPPERQVGQVGQGQAWMRSGRSTKNRIRSPDSRGSQSACLAYRWARPAGTSSRRWTCSSSASIMTTSRVDPRPSRACRWLMMFLAGPAQAGLGAPGAGTAWSRGAPVPPGGEPTRVI